LRFLTVVASLVLVMALSFTPGAHAQAGAAQAKANIPALAKEHCGQTGQPGTLYQMLCADTKPADPAPKHDISGAWEGPVGAVMNDMVPPMTDFGKKLASLNKTNGVANVADSNDPLDHCDPLGFPRNTVWEVRGLAIGEMTNRVLILSQYEKVWREVWTDGRALPKNAGSADPNAPDPRYYGYSTGHWDGDYTFVVDTVGTDDTTWLDNEGHPHTSELHVTERYTRTDHNTLKVTVNVDDPKIFTKPFLLGTTVYKWIPKQEFEEQLCIPSSAQAYLDTIANPAGAAKKK
jgi:hypothetical protein